MNIIVFSILIYMTSWLRKHRVNLSNGLHMKGSYMLQGLWGLLSTGIYGATVGYALLIIAELLNKLPI